MSERLQTGIEILDRKLGGGIPLGRTVALSASPASQSDLFLYEFAASGPTAYLTTMRSESAVRDALARTGTDGEEIAVCEVDWSDPVGDASRLVRSLPPGSNLVVDSVEAFERGAPARHWQFLDAVQARMAETDGVAVLHCFEEHGGTVQRSITEYVSDVVFRLTTERQGDRIENHLAVPKFRGGEPLEDVVKLDVSSGVEIDISRNLV